MKNLKLFLHSMLFMLGAWCYNVSEELADLSGRKWAIVQNPVTGRSRGKFAGAIFSTQFGKNTLRSKPLHVRNPQTLEQMIQRQRISVTMSTLRLFTSLVRSGFRLVATGMSAFNAAFKLAIQSNLVGSYPNILFNPVDLKLSSGNLQNALNPTAAKNLSNIDFNWEDNSGVGDALATDTFSLVCYDGYVNEVSKHTGIERSAATGTIAIPSNWVAGNEVYSYLFIESADGLRISESQYLGKITL